MMRRLLASLLIVLASPLLALAPAWGQTAVRLLDSAGRPITGANPLPTQLIGVSSGDGKILDGVLPGEADVIGIAPTGLEQGLVTRSLSYGQTDDTVTLSCAEDAYCVARLTTNRAVHVNLRDASGNEVSVGGGTQYDEDTASAAAEKLTMAGVVRRDTAASLVDTDGDRTEMQVDASGRLWVNVGAGTLTSNQGGAPWTMRVQDGAGATLATVTGANALKVDGSAVTQPVSGTVTVGTFPDNEPFNLNQVGGAAVTLGQKTSANSIPVVLPSDQTVAVSGPLTDAQLRATPVPVTSTATPYATPLTAIVTGQQAITTTATALPSNAGKLVCFKVLEAGTQNGFYGPSGVTTSTGQQIVPGEGACRPIDNANRVFFIAAGAGSSVAFEVYQ